MESIGQLAGGVAHDFNNILTAILSCSHLIAETVRSPKARAMGLACDAACSSSSRCPLCWLA